MESFFSLPFTDVDGIGIHHSLPSGSLLEAADVLEQFLSADDPLEEPDLNGPATLHCEICKKMFDNAKRYYGHLRVHSKDNLWICDKCPDQKFSTKQQLMKHGLTHKPLERVWKCPQCDMAFEALWRLQQHLFATHLNYRPHKCNVCNKTFGKLSDLIKHKSIHKGNKMHRCSECGLAVTDKSNLKRHMLTHTSEKNFKCEYCRKGYTQSASLKRHTLNCWRRVRAMAQGVTNSHPVPTMAHDNQAMVHNNQAPVHTNEATLHNNQPPVHTNQATVHNNQAPVHNNQATVHNNQATVHNNQATVHNNQAMVHNNQATVHNNQATVHNNQATVYNNQTMVHEVQQMVHSDAQMQNLPAMSTPLRQNFCRVCGMQFQYKSALLEHCVRVHANNSEPLTKERDEKSALHPQGPQHITDNKTYDSIVDDILSVEDDYSIVNVASTQTQNDILNLANYSKTSETISGHTEDRITDTLMQMEFLKEMNNLHSLDDELFYNDIDFDSFQTNQVFNNNDIDCRTQDRNAEILFDFVDGHRSIDQDLMNALYQVKSEHLPDDLLNVPTKDPLDFPTTSDHVLPDSVIVNECSTIFESDVDLEASTNLTMNLNQLIGENSVQYVSTEDDDTFIISLDSAIDAEKLSDLLNIGVEMMEGNTADTENNTEEEGPTQDCPVPETEPLVIKIQNADTSEVAQNTLEKPIETKVKKKKEPRSKIIFTCKTCKKVFKKRDNYVSHLGTHASGRRRHKCPVCSKRFGYRSTLNKHSAKYHEPLVYNAHQCDQCSRCYTANWMLKAHIERDHVQLKPFACTFEGCTRRFYKKCDLDTHRRYHTGERPFKCEICSRGFSHRSHLSRHARTVDCTKLVDGFKRVDDTRLKRNESGPTKSSGHYPKLVQNVVNAEAVNSNPKSVDNSNKGVKYFISKTPVTLIVCGSPDKKGTTGYSKPKQISLLRSNQSAVDSSKRTGAHFTKLGLACKEQKIGKSRKQKTVHKNHLKNVDSVRHNKVASTKLNRGGCTFIVDNKYFNRLDMP